MWLYVDSQFRGAVHKITTDMPKLSAIGLNDKASSLKCGPDTTVELFADSEYKGKSQVFTGDVPTFGAMNDKVLFNFYLASPCSSSTHSFQFSSLRFK